MRAAITCGNILRGPRRGAGVHAAALRQWEARAREIASAATDNKDVLFVAPNLAATTALAQLIAGIQSISAFLVIVSVYILLFSSIINNFIKIIFGFVLKSINFFFPAQGKPSQETAYVCTGRSGQGKALSGKGSPTPVAWSACVLKPHTTPNPQPSVHPRRR